MAYGFQFTNNSNVVTLDSEFARLVVLDQGSYSPNAENGLRANVNFSRVITSQEPPLVFAKPTVINGQAVISSVLIYGSPGNWTGFGIRTRSVNYAPPTGTWFVGAFVAQDVSDYGMQIFDGSGKLLFDSGNPCAIFTAAYQSWNYAFTQTLDVGVTNFFSSPKPINTVDYMLINNYSMNVVAGSNAGALVGSVWDFTNGTLYATMTSSSNSRTFYLPALFARLVA
ncbi:hypothetical protein [Pseudomonas abietaniphila]|uniref:Uncharacterized protein n=1 Tax=Pseudomonas abietaniphila TaxID=89065 RepID=A0A1G8URM9_9PSED|nr:hypothetical protein [Pseudomonas abietaniphila]SDJ56389.1 hypothetical protein SAMN05216605_1492 [Pseudomonas abietaniphila]